VEEYITLYKYIILVSQIHNPTILSNINTVLKTIKNRIGYLQRENHLSLNVTVSENTYSGVCRGLEIFHGPYIIQIQISLSTGVQEQLKTSKGSI